MKSYYVVTTKSTQERLSKYPLQFSNKENKLSTIKINPNTKFQQIIGFGGAFTESAAYTLSKITEDKRKEVIEAYFNPETGINYSIGRVHIHSCDFSLENYTYVTDQDMELKTFDISRDFKWVIPLILDAGIERGEAIKILASPWSPPSWMKSNHDMNHGGQLLPQYFESWAMYYTKFIKAYHKAGIDVKAITVQNEPAAVQVWDSCIYSAEEERDFIKYHLGPTMVRENLEDIKILIWDHNRDIMVERVKPILDDPEAAKYVWGTGFHWYVSEAFENVAKVHELFPDKHLIFTEGCQEGGCHIGAWYTGERYARNMIGDMNHYCEGYLDWNICLDETGGPNHVNNLCDAPIIVNTKTNEVIYNSSYYYIGHFSKYILPKAIRIESLVSDSRLNVISFINPNNQIVVIVLNQTDEEIAYSVELNEQTTQINSLAHSIHTIIYDNN